eukprot:Protomagalhaensia_sp_Gyna_25__249@NODE_1117_length_2174_cov_50_737705_g886_i0_p1_GENE_NODE_1117_length_2174_cov_50_737705_g886_i0NODE_1117_length_2174_cov_50_737705_g886_i0_p1_ORF_typecomplete_len447_score54_48_NODE_1117_length_2174_cov_50_737705_g886_i07282068
MSMGGDLALKYRGEVSNVQDLLDDLDKASEHLRKTLLDSCDIKEFAGSQRRNRLLGTRSSRVVFAPFECVQRCQAEGGIGGSTASLAVEPLNLKAARDAVTGVPYCPLTVPFQQLFNLAGIDTGPDTGDDDMENMDDRQSSATEVFRVLSFNPLQKTATVVLPGTLRKPPGRPDLVLGTEAPRVMYEGQILTLKGSILESGRSFKNASMADVPLVSKEGCFSFLCFTITPVARTEDVDDMLLALDSLCQTEGVSQLIGFVLGPPTLHRWRDLETEWNARHPTQLLRFMGVSKSVDPWDFDCFNRELVIRFHHEGHRLPLVFTSLPLVQNMGCRSVHHQDLNILDGIVKDLVKHSHMLPSLWMSVNPPSLHPSETASLEWDTSQDFVLVCPNLGKASTHLGRYGLYCGVFTPPLTVTKIVFSSRGVAPMPVWKRLQVEISAAQPARS